MRDGAADRTIKCSYTNPPRSKIYKSQCHFSPLYFPNNCRQGIGVLQQLPQRQGTLSIWVIRDLESHQTDRHFLGESPAEREHFESAINNLKVKLLWRVSSGKENPEAFLPLHTLTHALFIFPTIHHLHTLHPHPLFYHPLSPYQSLVQISKTPVSTPALSQFQRADENWSQVCPGWGSLSCGNNGYMQ